MNSNKITVLIFLSMLCSIQTNKGMLTKEKARTIAKKEYKLSKLNQKLLNASQLGKYEKAQEAIADGANVNYKDLHDNTPLIYATMYHKLNIAQLLLEKGADVNAKDHAGNSALTYAIAKGGNLELVKLLLGNDADTSINYQTYDIRNGYLYVNALKMAEYLAHQENNPAKKLRYIEIADYIKNYTQNRQKILEEAISIFLPSVLVDLVEEYTGHKPVKTKSTVCDTGD